MEMTTENYLYNKTQKNQLFHLVRKGDVKEAKKIGDPIKKMVKYMIDGVGRTILHVAVESMNPDMLKYCLTFNVDINRSAPFIGTALQLACSMGSLRDNLILVILLRNGAQIYGMTDVRRSPLMLIYNNHSLSATKNLMEEFDNPLNDRHHLMKPKRRTVQRYINKKNLKQLAEHFYAFHMLGVDYKRALKNGKWLPQINHHLKEFTAIFALSLYKQNPQGFDGLDLDNILKLKFGTLSELTRLKNCYVVGRPRTRISISRQRSPEQPQLNPYKQLTLRNFLILSDLNRQRLVRNCDIIEYFTKYRMHINSNLPNYGQFIMNAYDDAVNFKTLYEKAMEYFLYHIMQLPLEIIHMIFDRFSKGDLLNLLCAFENAL